MTLIQNLKAVTGYDKKRQHLSRAFIPVFNALRFRLFVLVLVSAEVLGLQPPGQLPPKTSAT